MKQNEFFVTMKYFGGYMRAMNVDDYEGTPSKKEYYHVITMEEHERRVKEYREALENIASTKKSDLMENTAYWGEMITGLARSVLSRHKPTGEKE